MKISKEEIVSKIMSSKNMTKEEIDGKIKVKIDNLSSLVSEQGAAYIVANELGVQLTSEENSGGFFKINQLSPDMRNISLFARVVSIQAVREFKKGGIPSKVGNVLISDDTGQCRLVIWDSRVSKLENEEIKENDILKVTSCYVKDNEYSGIEVHMRDKSILEINPADAPDLPKVSELSAENQFKAQRKNISEIKENELVEVLGTIVQLLMQKPFFEVCSECGSRLTKQETAFSCKQHGITKPAYKMVMGLILDDGTGNIRTTFFGKNVENLIGITSNQAFEKSKAASDELISIKEAEKNLLGKQILVKGRAKLNSFSGNIEIVANDIEMSIDLAKESSNIKVNNENPVSPLAEENTVSDDLHEEKF